MGVSVTAYLCCDGAAEAIAWYGEAFDAVELSRIGGPNGTIGHADLRIGEATISLSDEWAENNIRAPRNLGGNSVSLILSVPNVDDAFAKAVAAGAKVERPVRDEPFGRIGWVHDPWGHHWAIMTDAGSST